MSAALVSRGSHLGQSRSIPWGPTFHAATRLIGPNELGPSRHRETHEKPVMPETWRIYANERNIFSRHGGARPATAAHGVTGDDGRGAEMDTKRACEAPLAERRVDPGLKRPSIWRHRSSENRRGRKSPRRRICVGVYAASGDERARSRRNRWRRSRRAF
jgi:hypothetical protein